MKSELELRPVLHQKENQTEGHLFITVLDYQLIQTIRTKLKAKELQSSWSTLKSILSVQRRVTVSFKQRDNSTLNIRKATKAEKELEEIYTNLEISATPRGTQKLLKKHKLTTM